MARENFPQGRSRRWYAVLSVVSALRSPLMVRRRASVVTSMSSGFIPGSSARITTSPWRSRKTLTGGNTPAADGPNETSDVGRLSRPSRSCWRRSSSLNGLNTAIEQIASLASRGRVGRGFGKCRDIVAAPGSRRGDGDARRLGARGRLHADLEDAVSVGGRDGVRIDRAWEPHRALEVPVPQLAVEAAVFGILVLRLALGLDGQTITGHGDLDGFGIDTGQVGGDDELPVTHLRVDGGSEQLAPEWISRLAAFGSEEAGEEVVELGAQRRQGPRRTPWGQRPHEPYLLSLHFLGAR